MNAISSRIGLDPLEFAVIASMRAIGALPNTPHRKNSRTVDEVENMYGYGQYSAFEVLCTLSHIWECALPLIAFHGNNGGGGYPPAPANVTESRLSEAGALALTVADTSDGALPLRLINGTLYRGGTAPAFEPFRVVECLQRLGADSSMSDQDIIDSLGAPRFYNSPILRGDLAALYAGETVECTLSAHVEVVGTSARGATVSVTRFPPSTTPNELAEDLEHHTSDEAWEVFHEEYAEEEPRLPIKSVSNRSHGSIATSHQEVLLVLERGVPIEMFVEALQAHSLVREEITLAFQQPVAAMMREWIRKYDSEQTRSALASLRSVLSAIGRDGA